MKSVLSGGSALILQMRKQAHNWVTCLWSHSKCYNQGQNSGSLAQETCYGDFNHQPYLQLGQGESNNVRGGPVKRNMDYMGYRSHENWNQREGKVRYQNQISGDGVRSIADSNKR